MYISGGRMTISNCAINSSVVNGSGDLTPPKTHGAGLYILNAFVLLSNATITNSALPVELSSRSCPVCSNIRSATSFVAGTGPDGAAGEGESVYSLAAPTPTTGVSYLLPAPVGRFASPSFECEVNQSVCDWTTNLGKTFYNLSVRTLGDFPFAWCAAAAPSLPQLSLYSNLFVAVHWVSTATGPPSPSPISLAPPAS